MKIQDVRSLNRTWSHAAGQSRSEHNNFRYKYNIPPPHFQMFNLTALRCDGCGPRESRARHRRSIHSSSPTNLSQAGPLSADCGPRESGTCHQLSETGSEECTQDLRVNRQAVHINLIYSELLLCADGGELYYNGDEI